MPVNIIAACSGNDILSVDFADLQQDCENEVNILKKIYQLVGQEYGKTINDVVNDLEINLIDEFGKILHDDDQSLTILNEALRDGHTQLTLHMIHKDINKDIYKHPSKYTGYSLNTFSRNVRNNEKAVLKFVQNDGLNLKYSAFQNRRIILSSLANNPMAYSHAEPKIFHDLKISGAAYTVVDQLGSLTIFPVVCDRLLGAKVEFLSDYDVVLAAVSQQGKSLKHAAIELRSDIDIVTAAVANDGLALEYAELPAKNNVEIVLIATRQNGESLTYASDGLKAHHKLISHLFSIKNIKEREKLANSYYTNWDESESVLLQMVSQKP